MNSELVTLAQLRALKRKLCAQQLRALRVVAAYNQCSLDEAALRLLRDNLTSIVEEIERAPLEFPACSKN